MAEKLSPFYKLLKAEVPINITSEIKDTFDSVNKALNNAGELALKHPIAGILVVLMTDASLSAGYALMIEDNPDQKIQSKLKKYAPVKFGSEIFSTAQPNMSIYSKRTLGNLHGILEYAHIFWEATNNRQIDVSQAKQAYINQIQSLLRQKDQRFKNQKSRLCLFLAAESRSSRE